MSRNANEKRVSLVLSIFKGENFVCKKPSGCKLQITAKVGQQQLETGCIQLVSTDSEPQFYSQLVWSFSEREWRAIRSAKEAVKVECMLISERSNLNSVLGYCVLYVKDAFLMMDMNEVDPSNAQTSTLCGLKDPWKMYSPKLKLLLHFEESSFNQQASKSPSRAHRKEPLPLESVKFGQIKLPINEIPDKKPVESCVSNSPADKNIKNKSCFPFQVNSESGYFELGTVSEDDDLYILNITVISGTNLHMMRLPKNSSENTSFWVVEYNAYGHDIKTDAFQLALQEEHSRTFIGDQAKAKIRANSVVFWEYLTTTSLEFRLLRYDKNNEINKDVMGIGFVDLQELASPKITQLKYTLELISEHGDYPLDIHIKPEIKVLVELESFPNYFSSWKMIESSRSDISAPIENKGNSIAANISTDMFATCVSEGEVELNKTTSTFSSHEIEITPGENVEELEGALNKMTLLEDKEFQSPLQKEVQQEVLSELVNRGEYDNSETTNILSTKDKNGTQYEGFTKDTKKNAAAKLDNAKISPQIQELETDSSSKSPTSHETPSEGTDSSNKYPENARFELNGRSMAIVPPGSYKILIKLSQFWVKSRYDLNNFILSYAHPPVGIETPFVCSAQINPSLMSPKPDTQIYTISDGTYELTVIIPSFSEDLLGDLLKVKFQLKEASDTLKYFGFCSIPFGDIFLEKSTKELSNARRLKGEAPLYDRNIKRIGKMEYEIQLRPCDFPKTDKIHSPDRFKVENEDVVDANAKPNSNKTESPSKKDNVVESKNRSEPELIGEPQPKTSRVTESPNKTKRVMITTAEFEAWKESEEKKLKRKFLEKEKAYLTILSAEYKKREAERTNFFDDKRKELLKKEKDVERQANSLMSKENSLQEREHELQVTGRQKSLDQDYAQQEFEIKMRKLQDKFENEIDSLQHKNNTLNAELKSLKGQQLILEQKLEAKEEKIRNLIESRSHSPNSELLDKVNRLELENEVLKKDLRKAEKDRHEFKNQAKSLIHKLSLMQNERDMQLKDENENLRLQILASKEQKEVKKERKEIKGLSNQLREYREKGKTKSDTEKGIHGQLKERNKGDCELRGTSCDGDSVAVSSDRTVLNKEITRLSKQRQSLLETGCYNNYDQVVKEMEERIVNLAKRLS